MEARTEAEIVVGMVVGSYPLNLYPRILIVEQPPNFLKNDVIAQGMIT